MFHPRLPAALLLASLTALVAAGPVNSPSPDDLVRKGNAAYRAGNADFAEKLYADAEERTADPGLVAFNRAAVLFQKGSYRDAELAYLRVLDDAEIPPERRAKALYNRGVCMLKRGGDAGVYKSAAACFDLVLESKPTDASLAADARHNLELAKLLWAQARAKARNPERANDPPAEEPERKPKPQPKPGTDPELGPGDDGPPRATKQKPEQIPGTESKGKKTNPTDDKTPGSGNAPVLNNKDDIQPLSPDDTRALLKLIATRLDRDRKANNFRQGGAERPNVRDW